MIRLLSPELAIGARVRVEPDWSPTETRGTVVGLVDGEAVLRWDAGGRSVVLVKRIQTGRAP